MITEIAYVVNIADFFFLRSEFNSISWEYFVYGAAYPCTLDVLLSREEPSFLCGASAVV